MAQNAAVVKELQGLVATLERLSARTRWVLEDVLEASLQDREANEVDMLNDLSIQEQAEVQRLMGDELERRRGPNKGTRAD